MKFKKRNNKKKCPPNNLRTETKRIFQYQKAKKLVKNVGRTNVKFIVELMKIELPNISFQITDRRERAKNKRPFRYHDGTKTGLTFVNTPPTIPTVREVCFLTIGL